MIMKRRQAQGTTTKRCIRRQIRCTQGTPTKRCNRRQMRCKAPTQAIQASYPPQHMLQEDVWPHHAPMGMEAYNIIVGWQGPPIGPQGWQPRSPTAEWRQNYGEGRELNPEWDNDFTFDFTFMVPSMVTLAAPEGY